MAQLAAADDVGSLRVELAEIGRSLRSSFRNYSSFRSESNVHSARQSEEDEELLHWAAIERLPTFERLRTSVFDIEDDHHRENNKGKRVVDVTDLGAIERHLFIEKEDNRKLLSKLRKRLDKVGIKLPTVEVRYKNLSVNAKCEVVDGKPLPTLWNATKSFASQLSTPSPGSNDLSFQTVFPQNDWGQFKACLWKQYLSYWRNPSYNLSRIAFVLITSLLFAALFWKHGQKIHTQQDLFTLLGLLFAQTIFLAINSCMTVHPVVATERIVMYRERFAGMYSAHAYSLAQVAIEIPCALIQAFLFWIITYPSVGYYWTAHKIF
ncbi:hypothetical protein EJ110_NYTH15615 [Nymphaea thermarum]|nr:hypothetical protein EJ110_NYTH15615 [Nymphaea thermarum]